MRSPPPSIGGGILRRLRVRSFICFFEYLVSVALTVLMWTALDGMDPLPARIKLEPGQAFDGPPGK